jgi:hypothetical protein
MYTITAIKKNKKTLLGIVLIMLFLLLTFYIGEYKTRIYLIHRENKEWKDLTSCSPDGEYVISLDVCNCSVPTQKYLKMSLGKEVSELNFLVCTEFAGGDGVYAIIKINDVEKRIYLPSLKCKSDKIIFNKTNEIEIALSSEVYGNCDAEFVYFNDMWLK